MKKRQFTYGGRKIAGREPQEHREIRNQIAKIVRSVEVPTNGGYCFPRALVGSVVLGRFGIPCQIALGSMLYRAGFGLHDYVGFCEEDNRGHHPGRYHCWIESGEDLIDFSCGDWSKIGPEGEHNPLGLPPITWTFPPPAYIWRPREPFVSAWKPAPIGPPPGCAWYGPIAEYNQDLLDEAKALLLPDIENAVDLIFLNAGLPVIKIVDRTRFADEMLLKLKRPR
jgi:hypothetical protein